MPLNPASISTNNGVASSSPPDPAPVPANLPGPVYQPSPGAISAPTTVTPAESLRVNRERFGRPGE